MPHIEDVDAKILAGIPLEKQTILKLLMEAEEDALANVTKLRERWGATPDLWTSDDPKLYFKSQLDLLGFSATNNHIDIFELILKILPSEEINRLYNE